MLWRFRFKQRLRFSASTLHHGLNLDLSLFGCTRCGLAGKLFERPVEAPTEAQSLNTR